MYKNNYFAYFFGYLIQNIAIYSLPSVLLPFVASFNIYLMMSVNTLIAMSRLIMYFLKPTFAFISDLFKSKIYLSRKSFLFVGFLGYILTYFLIIIYFSTLPLFILLFTLSLISISFIDIAIDGKILDTSSRIQKRTLKIVIGLSGYTIGSFILPVVFIIIAALEIHLNEIYWYLYIQLAFFIIIGVVSLLLFDGINRNEMGVKKIFSAERKKFFFPNKSYALLFVIMAIGIFLYFLIDIPSLFISIILYSFGYRAIEVGFILTLSYIFNILGYIGAIIVVWKLKKLKRVLYVNIPILAIITILLSLELISQNFWLYLVLTQVAAFLGGTTLVILTSFMMDFSKHGMSFKFQILNSIGPVSYNLLIQSAHFFYGSLELSIISSIIIGMFVALSLIPLNFVKRK